MPLRIYTSTTDQQPNRNDEFKLSNFTTFDYRPNSIGFNVVLVDNWMQQNFENLSRWKRSARTVSKTLVMLLLFNVFSHFTFTHKAK